MSILAPEPDAASIPEPPGATHFPSSRLERSAIAATAGLKVGANYAKYLVRRAARSDDADTLRSRLHDENATDLFDQLVKLRGTALKLAQGMSLDPGLLPDEFTSVMAQAQYRVPPMNRMLVRRIVRQQLGADPEAVFSSFEPDAAAAASIGQVHRAVLKDGRRVAVKVQYPNVRQTIESDLSMARALASRIAPALLESGRVEPFIEEVRTMMRRETDYREEGATIEVFHRQYSSDRVVTPRWIPDLSTDSVLVMTWLDGVHLDAFLEGGPTQDERDRYGQLFWDFVNEQVASNNCTVHADVHPGNFLFREDGRLGVLDFGCIKTFPQYFRDAFLLIWDAHVHGRTEPLDGLYTEVEIYQADQSPELRNRIRDFFGRFAGAILAPYRGGTTGSGDEIFDFGHPSFRASLLPLFQEASQFNAAVGSPHFVFVNRMLFGLFSVLSRLGARVDVRTSVIGLETAAAEIKTRLGRGS